MNPFALDRSVAVVTGGGNGIGQATALAPGAAGASVAVLDRHGDAAAAVCDELSAAGIPALGLGVDVTDRPSVDAAIASVADGLGVPTVVVANAGYGRFGAFVDIEPKVWQRHLDVNLTGTFHVVQSAVRVMSNGGSIVLTGSTASSFPCDLFSAYATTKAGVAMLARSLAAELRPAPHPGQCRTPSRAMRSSSTVVRRRTASRAGSVSTLQHAGSTAPTASAWQPSRRNAVQ